MKRVIPMLLILSVVFHSLMVVWAADTAFQSAEITIAETGAVEDPSHPFLFGQDGNWEVTIDRFVSVSGDDMQMNSVQLARLISRGAIPCTVDVLDGQRWLSRTPAVTAMNNAAVLCVNTQHTYDTGVLELILQLRFRAVRNIYWDKDEWNYSCALYNIEGAKNTLVLEKGTLLQSEQQLFTSHYLNLSQYQSTITITQEDVEAGMVLADGEEMYMATGSDKMLSFDFGGSVFYTTCISAAQKPLNLYYSFDEIPEVAQLYPTMELFYVDFRGSPSFINSGELTFDAIGGETTVVYSFQDEVLSPMISVYNKDSNTVTVRGVKRLDTYVVAAESVEGHEAVYSSSNAVPVKIPNAVRVDTESNPSTG